VSWYQKGKTNLDFLKERDSEWQWHQLGHMQVCTSLQTDKHASTPPLIFLQAGCPSCCPTNSVKALKALSFIVYMYENIRNISNVLFVVVNPQGKVSAKIQQLLNTLKVSQLLDLWSWFFLLSRVSL